ncbi:hypothetical protein GAU_2356 [Gemmatimonas aurantiaca T-27]|uniref:MoaD/ThiS family protein n=2 Tax=Gemmatimonas aurantiaca TaxID=173480 RepID=C1AAZ2_GEMAT|nr:hypothetical protein GAU_2356 [Gemmatimonas aurantiaca T-27]
MAQVEVRAFVNERGVSVPAGSTALDAVRALLPASADQIDGGTARLTDSRGLPVDAHEPLVNGAIYRVVPVRERLADTAVDGDA